MLSDSPCLQAVQRFVNVALVEFDHVGVHLSVVIADVSLGAAVGHRPEAKRRGEGVGSLKLKTNRTRVTHQNAEYPL